MKPTIFTRTHIWIKKMSTFWLCCSSRKGKRKGKSATPSKVATPTPIQVRSVQFKPLPLENRQDSTHFRFQVCTYTVFILLKENIKRLKYIVIFLVFAHFRKPHIMYCLEFIQCKFKTAHHVVSRIPNPEFRIFFHFSTKL